MEPARERGTDEMDGLNAVYARTKDRVQVGVKRWKKIDQ